MSEQENSNKQVSVQHHDNNQFDQPYEQAYDQDGSKANGLAHKYHSGGGSSVKQKKTTDTTADRNAPKAKEKIRSLRVAGRSFNLLVDDVPYFVKVNPFPYNDETRFYINVNGGDDHVFTWDADIRRLRAIDDAAWLLPDALEDAINEKLQQSK
jgi:hypothetical protein